MSIGDIFLNSMVMVIVLATSFFSDRELDKKIEANTLLIEQLTYEQCGKSNHE